MLVVTNHIQGYVRLGYMPTNTWVGGVLLSGSDLFFKEKIKGKKFENAPFSFRDATYGDIMSREQAF